MSKYSHAKLMAEDIINSTAIPDQAMDRIQDVVKELLKKKPCIDVHTHFFDKQSTSTAYMVIRFAKDFLKIRGKRGENENELIERVYQRINDNPDDWDQRLLQVLESNSQRGGLKGILFKILRMKKMEELYDYYLEDSSLAKYFNKPDDEVLTTVLMMDFKQGWGVDTKKPFITQIEELKEFASRRPVLPFLFCDPRRVELKLDSANHLYNLFENAFNGSVPFFGVKHYPALGYHPNDYRLWPIYEICEKKRIPILSHCGGQDVSTDKREITVYNGQKEEVVKGKNRKEVAFKLNNPNRWEPVLKKFPNLVVNIAHFGSSKTWSSAFKVDDKTDPQHRKETIIALMEKYDNVYADFSFTITDNGATENLISKMLSNPKVRERTLFGSDFWVVHQKGELRKNQSTFLDMCKDADPTLVDQLCKVNPMRYLFG